MAAANSLPFDVFSQLSGAGFGSAANQPAVPAMGSNDLAASQTYALLAAALQQQQQQQHQQVSQQQQASQQMQQQQQQQQQPAQQHQQSSQSFPHISGYLAQQAGLAQAGLADALHPLFSSLDQQQLGQQSAQQSQQAQPLSQSTAGAQSSQHSDHQELLAHLQNQAAAAQQSQQQAQQQAQQQQQLQQFLQQQQYAALLSSLIPNASPQTPDRQPQSFPPAAYQSALDPSGQTDSSRLATLQLQLQLLQQQQAAAQQQQQGFSQLQTQQSGGQSPHQLAAAVAAAASLGRPMSPYSPILDPFTANAHPNARNLLLQQAYANAARHTSLGNQAGFDLAAARNSPQGWRAPFSPGRLSGIDSDAESVTSRGSRGFADLLGSAYDSDSALSTNSPSNGKNDAKKGGKPIRIKAARSGPKNPRSAYVFYVAEQRHKLAKAADLHTKSFRDVAMMVGQQWRELSAEDRRPYEEQARLDKERYLREKRENEIREGKRSLNLNPVALAGVGGDTSSPLSSRATTSTNGTSESHAFHRLRTPPAGSQPTSRATVQVNAAQRMASQARTLDLSTVATASGESSMGRPSVSTEGAVAGASDTSNPSPSAVSTSTASSLSSAPTASETPDVSSPSAPINIPPPPPRAESPLLGIKRKAPSDDEDTTPPVVDSAGSATAPSAPAAAEEPASDKSSASESAKAAEPSAESEQPDTKRVRTEGEVKNEASS